MHARCAPPPPRPQPAGPHETYCRDDNEDCRPSSFRRSRRSYCQANVGCVTDVTDAVGATGQTGFIHRSVGALIMIYSSSGSFQGQIQSTISDLDMILRCSTTLRTGVKHVTADSQKCVYVIFFISCFVPFEFIF